MRRVAAGLHEVWGSYEAPPDGSIDSPGLLTTGLLWHPLPSSSPCWHVRGSSRWGELLCRVVKPGRRQERLGEEPFHTHIPQQAPSSPWELHPVEWRLFKLSQWRHWGANLETDFHQKFRLAYYLTPGVPSCPPPDSRYQVALVAKNLLAMLETRDDDVIPMWGRAPGVWNGKPFLPSCLDNSSFSL